MQRPHEPEKLVKIAVLKLDVTFIGNLLSYLLIKAERQPTIKGRGCGLHFVSSLSE